jgi:uncharacterized protein
LVHTFENNGLYIALDVNSGSIHMVEEVVHRILKAYPDALPSVATVLGQFAPVYGEALVRDAYQELESLIGDNLLYTPEFTADQLARTLAVDRGLKAFCLHVAHDCNLRCGYCFAAQGDYQSGRRLMSREIALKALDFLVQNSGRHEIEVDFFGGEPMLNMEVVQAAIVYGREIAQKAGKKMHFTITTNGTLLNEKWIDYINKNLDNVVISIDGRPAVHDAMRGYPGGRGSYERIVPWAQRLVAERGNREYYVRGTFTVRNLDFADDVFHLADLGFAEISVEPAVGKIGPDTITRDHLPIILAEYDRLAQRYLERLKTGKPFRFYHFNLNLYKGPCIYKRITACGAGVEYLAVSPEGELYPCHQFVGQREFLLGNLDDGITNTAIMAVFKNANIFNKAACRDCWAKYFCSGGCPANSYFTNGNLREPDDLTCAMQKKRIECAMMVEVRRQIAAEREQLKKQMES